jgi:hypothetical protein
VFSHDCHDWSVIRCWIGCQTDFAFRHQCHCIGEYILFLYTRLLSKSFVLFCRRNLPQVFSLILHLVYICSPPPETYMIPHLMFSCAESIISAIYHVLQLLGLTCSVLCLYQVKLMPETYEMIVAAIQESNLTTPEPVSLPPGVTVSKNGNYNDRNMIRTTKKGRPRVSRYVRTICFV